MINGSTILVTGGSGSFGRRFTETILRDHAPKKIIIYSRDERHRMVFRAEARLAAGTGLLPGQPVTLERPQ